MGKSTLFNRIVRRRQAVVAEESGVTRDRHYTDAEWAGREFSLVDTGGIVETPDPLEEQVRLQAEVAIEQADLVVFTTDAQSGIMPDDEVIADILRKHDKPVVLAVNKVDNADLEKHIFEFHKLGLGDPMPISALLGRGVGDMLDMILKDMPESAVEVGDDSIRIAIVGRPNVGKSSLVNAFLNEERHIVTPTAGTTRDSVDSRIKFYGVDITLIDTAGLRRASRVKQSVEFFCSLRAERALDRSHIAMVLFDASSGLTRQDARIINEAAKRGKGIVLLANKWDLVDKNGGAYEKFRHQVYSRLANMFYIPLLTISAITKQRIHKALKIALNVHRNTQIRIQTSELNDYILPIIQNSPPPMRENKQVKIKYVAQVSIAPTIFSFHCNYPEAVEEGYRRFLERKIRERYDFTGVPIRLKFRRK